MLRFSLLSFLLFLLIKTQTAQAQSETAPMVFGKVPSADLRMQVFEADTTAAAVVLCDFGTASIEEYASTYELRWNHHRRLKILNKQGFGQADVAIPFYTYNAREAFAFEAAVIHLPNGQQINLTKKDVFIEKINEYYSLAKFTFPQVTEGCVIEYKYLITSKSIYELREWYFQEEIPVRYSEIRVNFPEERMSFVYLYQGNEGMVGREEKDGSMRYEGKNGSLFFSKKRFVMENVPAMKEEGYVTTMDDYRARIRFQLNEVLLAGGRLEKIMTDWKLLQKEIKEQPYLGEQLLKKGNHKKMVEQLLPLATNLATDKEKASFFYDYLTKNIKWDERYSMFTSPLKLSEIFEQGTASSGELNIMLCVLLEAAGVKANPVLLSTRSHGKMYEQYPILDQFNHLIVLAELGGKPVYMDATNPLRPMGYPSVAALNGRGLRLDFEAGEPTWVSIPAPKDGADVIVFDLKLDEEGTLSGTVTGAHKGYNAIAEREYFMANSTGAHWQKRLSERFPDAQLLDARTGNLHETTKTFYDTLQINIPNAAQVTGDYLYLPPVVYSEFDENLFKVKERNYPVDIPYPFLSQVVMNLTMPAGYVMESHPEMTDFSIPAGGGNFFFGIATKPGGVYQFSTKVNVSKQLFTPAEYPALKEMFDLLVKKQGEMIVLKKG
ncbi:MAG: DUF3857 and transglutaminase domain-containing protein [Saprospiraceae bacterium]|nr:DUF3857 and transglutaminase domain-containing protein [Saprospiraceae bacterium]